MIYVNCKCCRIIENNLNIEFNIRSKFPIQKLKLTDSIHELKASIPAKNVLRNFAKVTKNTCAGVIF